MNQNVPDYNPTVFDDKPPTPPTAAAQGTNVNEQIGDSSAFMSSIKRLLLNPNYILLLLSYGINVGVFYAISTLLNQIILEYYPGRETDVGRIGLFIVLAGMVGSVCCGIVLDKTHRFK